MDQKSKFYQSQWFMWILLIFFSPAGIVLMWKYNRYSKSLKIVLTAVFTLIFISFISSGQETGATNIKKDATNIIATVSPKSPINYSKSDYLKSGKKVAPTSTPIQENIVSYKQTKTKEVIVYVTRTGKKYHYEWCGYLRSSKIPIKLIDTKMSGYTPCKRCHPPN